ncbi:MAG: hypothetical protein ACLGHW_09415 [Gammaproteobacteria bacterium]
MLLLLLCACGLAAAPAAGARSLQARIERVDSAVATVHAVRMRLDWPAGARQGRLRLQAARLAAPGLGYDLRGLDWDCALRRDGEGGWHCDGMVRARGGRPLRLAVDLGQRRSHARLSQGPARIQVQRRGAAPDLTAVDLVAVPATWAQALLARAWDAPVLSDGRLDARLQVLAEPGGALQVDGDIAVAGLDFDTPDASIAGEDLSGRFALDWRKAGATTSVALDGTLHGGEFLAGRAYLDLQAPVALRLQARGREGEGWRLPAFSWRDAGVLVAEGSAAFDPQARLEALDLRLHSADAAPLARRYLDGWLGPLGLGELELRGALDAALQVDGGRLRSAELRLHGVDAHEPQGRFAFSGLQGTVRFSGGDAAVASDLRWRGGALYGLPFGAAALPLESSGGTLRLRAPASVAAFGGQVRFDALALQPPAAGERLRMRFGLTLERLDIARLAEALGWPAFQGTLSGTIPDARYVDDRLEFDGGLSMQLFEGRVDISHLALERPFGSAPSLSADIALDDLDLYALTEVFGFGSIQGRLDGRIDSLRLVGWRATAFDAHLYTDRKPGVPQRISQRAVQNISSVGDASFATSLQGRLIGLFDDFGYGAIGIRCRLRNEVCEMGGLRSGGNAFTIVTGAGLPRLTVIGHNRLVDWPLLVERLGSVVKGDVKPVFDRGPAQ